MDNSARVKQEKYILKLFVTGMSVSSVRAIENIKEICESYLKDNYTLEIVDVYKHPEIVQQDDIICCPTLIKKSPEPLRRLIGDLSDKDKVLNALGITVKS